jgi:hypothetical protein
MKISKSVLPVHVDWLTVTFKYAPDDVPSGSLFQEIARHLLYAPGQGKFTLKPVSTKPFYHYACENVQTGVRLYASNSLKQGYMMVYDGKACAYFGDEMPDVIDLLKDNGAKVTRLDVAIDLYETEQTPHDLWDACERYGVPGGRARQMIQGATGSTCYIGKRSSDGYLRCYDKAKQLGEEGTHIRYELEAKHDLAERLTSDIPMMYARAAEYMIDMIPVQYKIDWWQVFVQIVSVKHTELPRASKLPSDTLAWLLKSVVPSILRLADENPEEFKQFLDAVSEVM